MQYQYAVKRYDPLIENIFKKLCIIVNEEKYIYR